MSTPSWSSDPRYAISPPSNSYPPRAGSVPYDPIHAPSGAPLASVGRRSAALIIDYVAITIICFLLFIVLLLLVHIARPDVDELADTVTDVWTALFFYGWGPALFFYEWLFLMAGGRSIGKAILRIKVVGADGRRLTQTQAIIRSAIFGLPHTVVCLGNAFVLLDCLWALSDSETRQALHDKAARSVVIRA